MSAKLTIHVTMLAVLATAAADSEPQSPTVSIAGVPLPGRAVT